MPEATFQHLTTNISGVEPTFGDVQFGELAINTAEGRLWAGDASQVPIELGGAVKKHPMGDPEYCNYVMYSIGSSDSLPIKTIDPTTVLTGYFQSVKYLVEFISDSPVVTFDNPIDWGSNFLYYNNLEPTNTNANNPIEGYKLLGRKIMFELSSFGRSTALIGRIIWIS